jgi:two-component system, cell cycle sensor histidine kinase and response regulator CckA
VASGRLEALLAGPAADLRPAAWEGSVERQDGTGATVEVSATAVAWDMGPAVLFVVRDITERRRLEAALRRSQRLDAMARLAGGLAHDFRNYLGTLRTTALLLRDQLPAQGTPREDADLIVALADQASGMVSQLLAFAQRQELAPTRLDLNPLVRSWQPVLQHLLGRAGTLRVTLADRELWTLADPIQLQQVVTNLVANARDALGAGGRVTLTTGTVEAGGREWVRLSVTDDGAGMPPDVLERIFEPFYSTKASGTGLGLAMVHGIVQQLGGCVEVESAAGQGTTVHVDLPVAPPATDGG